jgi:formylglycine-generating enzyme required for sulfatase activity/predicted Ser/Thr protein kinase
MPVQVLCPNPRCGVALSGTSAELAELESCPRCGAPLGASPSPYGAPPSLALALTPGSSFGRYRIERTLGHGGMGSVFLAHDTQLDRPVALKIPHIPPGSAPDVLRRFYREARAAAALDHPNLCPVYDVGEVDGTPYLTMAYIDGRPLSQLIGHERALPQRQVAAVIRKLALALQEAHDRGVVHRDLKPANVLVSRKKDLVIVDFGLARREDSGDSRLTQSGMILGTPAYMAPEQVAGELDQIGPASDIYSLGVILYEMLSGRTPFEGSAALVLGQIVAAEPEPVSAVRPDVDPPLAAICKKAMAKKPDARYAAMGEFAAALSAYLRGEAEPGSPPDEMLPIPVAGPPPATAGSETLIGRFVDRFGSREAGAPLPIRMNEPPEPVAAGGRPRRPISRRAALVAAGAAALLALLGVVIYVATDKGTVKIELSDPQAKAAVKVELPPKLAAIQVTEIPSRPGQPTGVPPSMRPEVPAGRGPSGTNLGEPLPALGSVTNSIGMTLRLIPAGEFLMGSPDSDASAEPDEKPRHRVRITKPFYLSLTEVTQGQYRAVMGDNPSQYKGSEDLPVEQVSWLDAVTFCNSLSEREGRRGCYRIEAPVVSLAGGDGYRLPTEAEWEYACRAGTTTRFVFGDDAKALGQYAWYDANSEGRTHAVGQRQPNAFGLYDLQMNVWEWCWDGYDGPYYNRSPANDPRGPEPRALRVIRGGSLCDDWRYGRSAKRAGVPPESRGGNVGFRVARAQSGVVSKAGTPTESLTRPPEAIVSSSSSSASDAERPSPAATTAIEPEFTPLYTRGDPLKQGWKKSGPGSIAEETAGSGVLLTRGGMGLLCYTARRFQDFILKLDYKVSSPADNSGVYFGVPRDSITPGEAAGRSFEVQIFDAGFGNKGTGAIWNVKGPDRPAAPGRPGEWVEMEIQVKGRAVQVSLRGQLINTYRMNRVTPGYIGLQNLIREDGSGADSEVRFRNIRIKRLDRPAATPSGRAAPTERLRAPTRDDGFRPVFNGNDLTGWAVDSGPTNAWRVVNGELVVTGPGGYRKSGFLLTSRDYSEFLLKFEFQASRNANSGVAFWARPGERFEGIPHPVHGAGRRWIDDELRSEREVVL